MDLVVRVRAAGDSSLTSVFRPLLAASAAASRGVEANLASSGKGAARAAAEGAAAHKTAASAQAASIKAIQALRNADHREFLANLKTEEAEAKKTAKAIGDEQRKQAKASEAAQKKALEVASGAARTFGSLMRSSIGVAKDVGAGFGIDFSLQGGLARSMQRNSTAIALSNAAYKDGGARESVAGLESTAMATGAKYKLDPTSVIEGLAQYQKLTGDLATGKAGLDGLAALAGATTTKLDDMFAAAGNVGNALGEVGKEFKTPEEKAKAVLDVMKSVAAFGQEGAVEVSDLSKQMAKVAAAAGFFEGDRGENLKKMTALAQLARMSGGAASATQAATSVLSFANILRTPARRAQFKEAGIDVDSATQKGQLRDPIEIIKEALTKTGGAIEPMKKMFANVMGDKPVTALATAYNKAGGGEAGMKAVDAMLAKFGGAMSDAQIASNNAERMKGKEAAGVDAQIQLDQVYSELSTALLPALREFTPVAKAAAQGLSWIVKESAQHPVAAITAALVASIGKAALGEAAGKALGSALVAAGGKGAAIGALAIAATAVYLQTKKTFDEGAEGQSKGVGTQISASNSAQIMRDVASGRISKEDALKKLEETYKEGSKDVKNAEQKVSYWSALNPFSDTSGADVGRAQALQETGATVGGKTAMDEMKANLANVKTAMDQLAAAIKADSSRVKDVNIVGGLPAPGPAVNNAARSSGVQ